MVSIRALPGDEPLTDSQHKRYQKFCMVGDEMRTLYRQTAIIMDDMVITKKNRSHKKLYKLICRLLWSCSISGYNVSGLAVWSNLDTAVFLVCDSPDDEKRLLLNGVDRYACDIVAPGQSNGINAGQWTGGADFHQAVHLDKNKQLTEDDLALIVAYTRRYKEWVESVRPYVEAVNADGFCQDINKVEQEALRLFSKLLKNGQ